MTNLLQKSHLMATVLLGGFSICAMADNVKVKTAAELEAAIQSNRTIEITADIDISNVISIKNISNLTIVSDFYELNGQEKTAIFDIENSTVRIDGVVFADALRKQSSDGEAVRGGAIRVSKGELTVVGCEFNNNKVVATTKEENFYGGGAINADEAVVNIGGLGKYEGVVFDGNEGYQGGAIMLRNCKGLIQNCEFKSNHAFPSVKNISDDAVRGGGAILVRWEGDKNNARKLDIFKCKFSNNTAKRYGGAIVFWAGGGDKSNELLDEHKFTVQGCSFVGNKTLIMDEEGINKDCGGGAISVSPGRAVTVNIFTSTFYKNSARNNGGAIDIRDEKDGDGDINCMTNVNIVNCTIAGNSISNDGGGNGGGLRMRTTTRNGLPTVNFSLVNTIIVANKSKKDTAGDNLNNSDFRFQSDGEVIKNFKRVENCVIRDCNDRANAKSPLLREDFVLKNNFWNTEWTEDASQTMVDPNANRIFEGSESFGDDGNIIPDGIFDEKLGIFWLSNSTENHATQYVSLAGTADDVAKEFGINTDQLGNVYDRNYIGAVNLLNGENEDRSYDADLDIPAAIETIVSNISSTTDAYFYTISGTRVVAPSQPGMYIHNGKKFIIKK